ncbi:DUF1638 domain-containing protein [Thalassobius vesicularis]|uniref:DUF1638 domain-containing protein n=1 Tax=Thalassobius vesicularis TaxID=1294297 RepID=A0A4S3MAZ4_9RHOB|nr:DUF1638 domain-containing protein [Thalassobius vesicularis]THD73503.1 DUF1638 domain-containing protein [Thalassobius vesicularis]
MTLPSDASLTTDGLPPTHNTGRVLIIACGALAREILTLIELNNWSHMDLTCLPAILHNHPEKIATAVEQAITKHRATHAQLFVAYADCGTGGALEQVCGRLGVQMIAGPHCYSFFEGNTAFARHDDEITAFYLTDFLTRQFDAFVWKPLGLDRHPQLRDSYFGHYTKLVYQAQTDDPALTAKAQDAAARLGLAFERRFTGYGDLATALADQA